MFGTPRFVIFLLCGQRSEVSQLSDEKLTFTAVKHDMHPLTPPTVLLLLTSLEYYGSAIFHAVVKHPTPVTQRQILP